jgi:Rad3-related DNA helicase
VNDDTAVHNYEYNGPFYGQCAYFQEIRKFLVSEVKVVHALCVVSGVEHKHDSRPSFVTHGLLRLSQYVSIIAQEVP